MFAEVMKNLPEGFEWVIPQTRTVNEYLKVTPFNLPSAEMTYCDFVSRVFRGRQFSGSNHLYQTLARIFPRKFPAYEVISRQERREALKLGNYDIYHCGALEWSALPKGKPMVVTICDLIPEIMNHDKMMADYRRRVLRDAKHVIAITEYTKHDIVRLYGVDPQKISVTYLGYNMPQQVDVSSGMAILPRFGLERNRFVFFVGKRAGYKNFTWMVQSLLPLVNKGLKVFCTGSPFSRSEVDLLKRLGVCENVMQSFVSDAEMKVLFENALAFIHPSRYEGFGIPILDAFAAGCPALVAKASCFPEVAGDAARYFDPKGDGADLRLLCSQMTDNAIRNEMIARGFLRLKNFSWKKCARETAQVYEFVHEMSRRER